MLPAPGIEDINWLETAAELYLEHGDSVEIDRPIFQGDVFRDVPLLTLPKNPPLTGAVQFQVVSSMAMVVPHPCQCYHGDKLRSMLTVAPVRSVDNYDNFQPDRTGAKDKFALLDLPIGRNDSGEWDTAMCVADFGKMLSVPNAWLKVENRVACLSRKGMGLLAKRVIGFQLRMPVTLAAALAYTEQEWAESFLMQAWVRKNRSLRGFTEWMDTERVLTGVNADQPVRPMTVRASAFDAILAAITGEQLLETTTS